MNLRRGFRRITFLLAIIAGTCGAVVAVSFTIGAYRNELGYLRWKQENFSQEHGQSWRKLTAVQWERPQKPKEHWDIFDKVAEETRKDIGELKKLESGFCVNLSRPQLAGLCIAAAFIGGTVSFGGTWFIVWFGGLGVHKLLRWVVLGFMDNPDKEVASEGPLERMDTAEI